MPLYACGSNGNHQLGLGHSEDIEVPTRVPGVDFGVAKISSGGNHTLILSKEGLVFAAGSNSEGQCSLPQEHIRTFTQISSNTFQDIACGWEYSVLLSDGVVYTCGAGPKGELGRHEKKSGLTKVDLPQGVVRVFSSLDHVVAVYEDGDTYGWGHNKHGKLGKFDKRVWTPVKIGNWKNAQFALAREYTAVYHDMTLTILGKSQATNPPNSLKMCLMWSSLHFLTKEHTIKSYGNNSHGQLFTYSQSAKDMTVGSEHGVLLDDQNCVYAWGWGEHGNCGLQSGNDLTELFRTQQETVTLIFGGCATTFIATK